MAENLFVRLPDSDDIEYLQWLLLDEASGVVRARGEGIPDELAGFVQDTHWTGTTIVLVPSEQVLLTSANVPSKKARQIVQALPFVIEEQLAVNVERMHLAMGDRTELGEIRVAAVESEIIARWLELLDDTGLSPGIMVPDVLCVPGGRIPGGRIPGGSDEVNILLDGQRALCRIGLSEGFAVDRDQLSIFLGLLDDAEGAASGDESDKSENKRGFRVYSDQTDAQQVLYAQWQAELAGALQHEPLDYQPFETLCREYHSKYAINLLQGEFKPQIADSSSRANWGSVAALVLVGFLLHVSSLVGQGIFLNTQAEQYKEQAQQLYKKVFPNDRNVRDLRRRWQSHLNSSGNSKVSNDFLSMFSAAASELKNSRLQLDNVNFNQKRGDLILQLRAPSSDQLVAYSQKITAAGLRSEIGTINQEADSVKGSIRIRGFRVPGS
ncbi:MAG: type II secretion system protein GspL [Gammaproteobacteria bacterium]|nr:type II secretion system protein GspL [Gammaproteobacteria bacterium]